MLVIAKMSLKYFTVDCKERLEIYWCVPNPASVLLRLLVKNNCGVSKKFFTVDSKETLET